MREKFKGRNFEISLISPDAPSWWRAEVAGVVSDIFGVSVAEKKCPERPYRYVNVILDAADGSISIEKDPSI